MCLAGGCEITPSSHCLLCPVHWDALWGDIQPKQLLAITVLSKKGYSPGVIAELVRCSRKAVEFVLWGQRHGWKVPRTRRNGLW